MVLVLARRLAIVAVAILIALPGAAWARSGGGSPSKGPSIVLPIGYTVGPVIPDAFGERWDYSYAYYPTGQELVVFGGGPADVFDTWHNDTWLLTAGGWQQGPTPPAGLTARRGVAMAYLPSIDRVVMFGGEARADDGTGLWPPYSNQTWLWDGTNWSEGPAAPPELAGRVGADMVYDDALGKLVLFGGSGLGRYTDTWLFDGSAWARGPDGPTDMNPRLFFGMAYDEAEGQVVLGGGDGETDVWLFDGSAWTRGPDFPDTMKNPLRERTRMAYDPQLGAVVLFGGLGPLTPAEEVYYLRGAGSGTWTLLPQDTGAPATTPPLPRLDGGIAWFPPLDAMVLFGGSLPGNLGRTTFMDTTYFRDVAPATSSVTVTPSQPNPSQGVDASMGPVTGGYLSTRAAIRWLINGEVVPGETKSHLDPQYQGGDQIQAQVQVTDAAGLVGPWVSSPIVTVISAGVRVLESTVVPGSTITVSGGGFAANEAVDIRLLSETGPLIGTVAANANGAFGYTALTTPVPAPGGPQSVFGIGRQSGLVSTPPASVTVLPGAATLTPSTLGKGQAATFAASGFVIGEQVQVSFPHYPATTATANSNGDVFASLTSPAEPWPGGDVIAVGSLGSAAAAFTTLGVVTITGDPVPGAIPISLSGFAPNEYVTIDLDGTGAGFVIPDFTGSAQATVVVPTTFGRHTVTATGTLSGATGSANVDLNATMTIQPTSGPYGTVVTISSGPGWTPNGTVDLYIGRTKQASFVADADGVVDETITILRHTPGQVQIRLRDLALSATAKAIFTVTG